MRFVIGHHGRGENNPRWKGNDVGYFAIHRWIRKKKPKPDACEDCHKATIFLDLANITGKHERNEVNYKWLCRQCHTILDQGKVTWDQVKEIRQLRKEGITYRELSMRFGCHPMNIYCICKGKSWKERGQDA